MVYTAAVFQWEILFRSICCLDTTKWLPSLVIAAFYCMEGDSVLFDHKWQMTVNWSFWQLHNIWDLQLEVEPILPPQYLYIHTCIFIYIYTVFHATLVLRHVSFVVVVLVIVLFVTSPTKKPRSQREYEKWPLVDYL